jgi:hypothetical protein
VYGDIVDAYGHRPPSARPPSRGPALDTALKAAGPRIKSGVTGVGSGGGGWRWGGARLRSLTVSSNVPETNQSLFIIMPAQFIVTPGLTQGSALSFWCQWNKAAGST